MSSRILLICLSILLVSSFASALTASLGNSRMILDAEVGDSVREYVLVKNVNNVTVNISLSVSGDLESLTTLEDTNFILFPGGEKKAYFEIEPKKKGGYETKINVAFTELDKKNGVGLAATIILNVYGEGEIPVDDPDTDSNNTTDDSSDTNDTTGTSKNNTLLIFLLITPIILIILLFLLMFMKKGKLKKKRSDRSS